MKRENAGAKLPAEILLLKSIKSIQIQCKIVFKWKFQDFGDKVSRKDRARRAIEVTYDISLQGVRLANETLEVSRDNERVQILSFCVMFYT